MPLVKDLDLAKSDIDDERGLCHGDQHDLVDELKVARPAIEALKKMVDAGPKGDDWADCGYCYVHLLSCADRKDPKLHSSDCEWAVAKLALAAYEEATK